MSKHTPSPRDRPCVRCRRKRSEHLSCWMELGDGAIRTQFVLICPTAFYRQKPERQKKTTTRVDNLSGSAR